jgi:hypothetical protein
MDSNLMQEDYRRDLTRRKSSLILQAQYYQALHQYAEAAQIFLAAARLEEELAESYHQAGRDKDAAINRLSAASCYEQAEQMRQATVPSLPT